MLQLMCLMLKGQNVSLTLKGQDCVLDTAGTEPDSEGMRLGSNNRLLLQLITFPIPAFKWKITLAKRKYFILLT